MSDTKRYATKNFYTFANAAWDDADRAERPKWPKTLKGMSALERKQLNAERIAWLESMPPFTTSDMIEAHDQLDELLMIRKPGSQRCFGLVGEPHLGKTEILSQYVYQYHRDHTDERPFATEHEGDHYTPIPVVWVHTASTFKATMRRFVTFCGGKAKDSDTADILLKRAIEQVEDFGIELVVFDDLHNLKGKGVASELKGLYEHLEHTTMLFTRTNDACAALDAKSGGNQTLHRTVWHEVLAPAASSEEWEERVARLELSMPWCNSKPQTGDYLELLHHRTSGRLGDLVMLFELITARLIKTNKNGPDIVTEELIESIKLPKDVNRRRVA